MEVEPAVKEEVEITEEELQATLDAAGNETQTNLNNRFFSEKCKRITQRRS